MSIVDPQSREIASFLMNTLPFGSVASVLHFNRVSRLLWRLGLEMGILWTNYFSFVTREVHHVFGERFVRIAWIRLCER